MQSFICQHTIQTSIWLMTTNASTPSIKYLWIYNTDTTTYTTSHQDHRTSEYRTGLQLTDPKTDRQQAEISPGAHSFNCFLEHQQPWNKVGMLSPSLPSSTPSHGPNAGKTGTRSQHCEADDCHTITTKSLGSSHNNIPAKSKSYFKMKARTTYFLLGSPLK